ncbi:MAG: helix-hairpin-helix domain-containing protein [Acidimicrobiaceae bacterium]|nr:helix-hairpin-helix domain-containing protein [Acidimicrobiaceae bacterium]
MTDGERRQPVDGSWQPDPTGRHKLRWQRGGGEWTDHIYSHAGEPGLDPYVAAASSSDSSARPRRGRSKRPLYRRWWAFVIYGVLAATVVAQALESPEPESSQEVEAIPAAESVSDPASNADEAASSPEFEVGAQEDATSGAPPAEAAAPGTSVPEVSVPEVSVPEVSVPEVSVPEVSVPEVSVPEVTVPEVTVPEVTVPEVTVPEVTVPAVSLPVAPEYDPGYDRDEWGPHNSNLCRGAVGAPDPYSGTPIDTCNVDHVVALHEAHESGGWDWPNSRKQQFSQDPANHVASRACVNQSKGGDDLFEWSDADIASSSACGGGYRVTASGRCFLARTTVAVKADWGLSVDQSEADALSTTLTGCGDQVPDLSASSQAPTTPAAPTTTVVPLQQCVIAGRSAAEYDAVSGIGETLAARLVAAQPFTSRADLQRVNGIGPTRSEAVWSHFCGP